MELFNKKNLQEFGKDYVKILTIMLKRADKRATGALINSLDYRIQDEAKAINIVINSNDYLEYVDRGRKPGTYPNIRAISNWAKVKGISQEAVFPIARSIYKFGIKPTNVIQKTITEIETSKTLERKFEDDLVENIEKIIEQQFNIEE